MYSLTPISSIIVFFHKFGNLSYSFHVNGWNHVTINVFHIFNEHPPPPIKIKEWAKLVCHKFNLCIIFHAFFTWLPAIHYLQVSSPPWATWTGRRSTATAWPSWCVTRGQPPSAALPGSSSKSKMSMIMHPSSWPESLRAGCLRQQHWELPSCRFGDVQLSTALWSGPHLISSTLSTWCILPLQVMAIDRDKGVNAEIKYSIVSGEWTPSFLSLQCENSPVTWLWDSSAPIHNHL